LKLHRLSNWILPKTLAGSHTEEAEVVDSDTVVIMAMVITMVIQGMQMVITQTKIRITIRGEVRVKTEDRITTQVVVHKEKEMNQGRTGVTVEILEGIQEGMIESE